MSILSRITARRRVRDAARRLSLDPSAENYVALAHEHVVAGSPQEVLRVCTEGLQIHSVDPELTRLAERAKTVQLDSRLRSLQKDLQTSPRPALWREMCDILVQTGRVVRAEETAEEWYEATKDGESLYYRARCRAELFFNERRAEDGRVAYELAEECQKQLGSDVRPLQLQFEIARRAGAWQEARTAIARLLELMPGNAELEARFRSVISDGEQSRILDDALAEVERTGRFVDDAPEAGPAPANALVRPVLQELGTEPGVHAVVFLRGGTALVQGAHGPTADRTARMVRDVLQRTRNAARRMALGRPLEVQLEGDFGSFHMVPGELGSAAIWSLGAAKRHYLEALRKLAGVAGGAA